MDGPLPPRITIDASLVEGWLQCDRQAWLRAHAPALAGGSDGLASYLATQRADLRSLLPDVLGGRAASKVAPPISARLRSTVDAMNEKAALCLDPAFEAPLAALAPGNDAEGTMRVLAMADALRRSGEAWELILLANGTKARDHHVRSLALASAVAAHQGIDTRRATVLHVDRQGRRNAPRSLLASTDVTDRWLPQRHRLPHRLAAVAASLAAPHEPTTATGPHCLRPRRCPFVDHCRGAPRSQRIDGVSGLRASTRRALRSAGWTTLDDVPDDVPGVTSFERDALRDARAGRPRIRVGALRQALDRLRFPIAYLDLEFATAAVPLLDKAAPFDAIPFQFSVHIEAADGTVRHAEHLAHDLVTDPRPVLSEHLANVLSGAGSVVVYDAASERRLLQALQTAVSGAAAAHLQTAAGRLWDLLAVLQETVNHPGFAARWDLKGVASTLAASNYDAVRLADGLTAQAEWRRWLGTHDPAAEDALRRYCAADSHAMVKIVRVLRTWLRDPPPPPA